MRIGLTYDLRAEYLAAGYGEEETAEFDSLETIDAIDHTLQELGHQTVRIGNARQLIQRLANGERWDVVFNICEGLYGCAREAQVPAILDVFDIPYTFADPCAMSVCLDKGIAKTLVNAVGISTPGFVVVNSEKELDRVALLRYPLFAKPLAEGTGKGVTPASKVDNRTELAALCHELWRQYHQPVIVEEYLQGREFTVGILGTGASARCLGTLKIILREGAEDAVYSYVNKERCEDLVEYRLVHASDDLQVARAEELALLSWRTLNCRDGGRIDLRCDAGGNPQFLEANPLAGLHPTHSDLPMLATAVGMSYATLLDSIVRSAAGRVRLPELTSRPKISPGLVGGGASA
ncbi:MAG: D-alanine--D-alanine ligase [Planctomycetales bacterium]|nr:D-alanine--D-alanine ligase [Planctomycetales bacterium]